MTNDQIQAEIHKRIAPMLCKRDQGRVMGEVRAVLSAHRQHITKAVGNLLARIHRDGGHYQAEHGTLKALEDAEREVVRMLSIADTAGAKPVSDEQEREQFDKWWATTNCEAVDMEWTDEKCWFAWKARAAIAAPPAPSVADAAGASEGQAETLARVRAFMEVFGENWHEENLLDLIRVVRGEESDND